MHSTAHFPHTKVLIVDDSADSRFLLSMILKRWGIVSDVACDGEEGVSMALSGDYDLVLMDTQMPVFSGHEATNKLRSAGFIKPIIAVSAHSEETERPKALASGCDDYIEKPFNRGRLLEILRHFSSPAHPGLELTSLEA